MPGRLLVILSFVFCIQNAAAEERPEVGRYVKAFTGDLGITVWMTRLGPPGNNEVIIQVEGVDHPWDKVITKHRVEYGSDRETYVATLADGSEFRSFLLTGTSGELYLPSAQRTMRVSYDRALAAQGNPQHFLTDYLKQEAAKASKREGAENKK